MYWRGRKVLVTGGASFIYSYLEQAFQLAASHGGRGYMNTHPVEYTSNMVLDGTLFVASYKAGRAAAQTQVNRLPKLPCIGWIHTTGLMQIWQDYCRLVAKGVSVGKERF